jgi:hypothetical protein
VNAVIDNDIIYKGACYGILTDMVSPIRSSGRIGVLGAARFVVVRKITRATLERPREHALDVMADFFAAAEALEPRTEEQQFAADLELAAQRSGLNLDAGESQLCAIAVTRLVPLLLTGDKRAIIAMEQLLDVDGRLGPICGKVACLEQVIKRAVDKSGVTMYRAAICAEPGVDRALTACFACSSTEVRLDRIINGLDSYILDLRSNAAQVLTG